LGIGAKYIKTFLDEIRASWDYGKFTKNELFCCLLASVSVCAGAGIILKWFWKCRMCEYSKQLLRPVGGKGI
jgi:hypothetical protein